VGIPDKRAVIFHTLPDIFTMKLTYILMPLWLLLSSVRPPFCSLKNNTKCPGGSDISKKKRAFKFCERYAKNLASLVKNFIDEKNLHPHKIEENH